MRRIPGYYYLVVLAAVVVVGVVLGLVLPTALFRAPAATTTPDLTCANNGVPGAPSTTVQNVTTSTNLQTAINNLSAAGGGYLNLAAGTYTISAPLVLRNNVGLVSTDISGSEPVIKAGPSFLSSPTVNGGHPLITTNGASNTTVANLILDQSGDTLNGNVSGRLSAYLMDVRNSTNAIVEGVTTRNPYTYSIVAVGSNHFCFYRNNVSVATSGRYNQLDGIHVLDSNTGWVLNNYVDNRLGTDGDDAFAAHTINAPTYGVTFSGNVIRGGNNGDDMQLAVGRYPIYNLTITNNEMWGGPFGLRTGYYASPGGSVDHLTITGNNVHNNVGGNAFPTGGQAIAIGYYPTGGGPVSYVSITNNRACSAGAIQVVSGTGNVATNNTTYTGCVNAPSSNPSGRVALVAGPPPSTTTTTAPTTTTTAPTTTTTAPTTTTTAPTTTTTAPTTTTTTPPPSGWTALGLQNGWHQAWATPAPAYRVNAGEVVLRGGLNGGATGQVITTLPVGDRPPADEWYPVVTGANVVGTLVIHPDGAVVLNAGNTGFLALDSVVVHTG